LSVNLQNERIKTSFYELKTIPKKEKKKWMHFDSQFNLQLLFWKGACQWKNGNLQPWEVALAVMLLVSFIVSPPHWALPELVQEQCRLIPALHDANGNSRVVLKIPPNPPEDHLR
jgi:hypothetical protein